MKNNRQENTVRQFSCLSVFWDGDGVLSLIEVREKYWIIKPRIVFRNREM